MIVQRHFLSRVQSIFIHLADSLPPQSGIQGTDQSDGGMTDTHLHATFYRFCLQMTFRHYLFHIGSSSMKSLALELKGQLELMSKVRKLNQQPAAETKATLIKETVQEFIEMSLRAGASENEVKKVLSELYSSDLLLSEDIYKWVLSEVSTAAQAVCLEQTSTTSEKLPPLFCKETLYHASLCCYAVSTCDANTYQKFFDKDFPNHSLEEASLSRSRDREQVDRYLIARHDKTYYVAFQSEPLLAQWPKFTSFQEGMCIMLTMLGTSCIKLAMFISPLRYQDSK